VELHAIDSSPTAVKMCQEHVARVGGKADVRAMDGLALVWPDSHFDAVVAFHYFAHMPAEESEAARREAVRVLKPGGKLFFKEFGTGDFRNGKGTETEPGTFRRRGGILTHYYTEGEVRGLFPALKLEKFEFERWKVMLKGTVYPRERVHAEWSKPA
jgi:MPBQ/MSBQ methyltransferase